MIFNIGGCSTNWNINNTITPYVHSCWDFHMQYSSLEARGLIISDVSLFWNYHLSPDYRDHFLQRKRMPFFWGGGVLYLQWGPCLPQGPSTNLQELPNLELAMLTPSHQWWKGDLATLLNRKTPPLVSNLKFMIRMSAAKGQLQRGKRACFNEHWVPAIRSISVWDSGKVIYDLILAG